MNKLIITTLLLGVFFTLHARHIDIKLEYKTNLKSTGVHQLIIDKSTATIDGIKLDSTLIPVIIKELSVLSHFTVGKKITCQGGSYLHTVIIDKKKKIQKGCLEEIHFGKTLQAFKTIKSLQRKLY